MKTSQSKGLERLTEIGIYSKLQLPLFVCSHSSRCFWTFTFLWQQWQVSWRAGGRRFEPWITSGLIAPLLCSWARPLNPSCWCWSVDQSNISLNLKVAFKLQFDFIRDALRTKSKHFLFTTLHMNPLTILSYHFKGGQLQLPMKMFMIASGHFL